MKTRRNIQGVFKNDNKESELTSATPAEITSITTYPTDTNDFYVYYTYLSVNYKISFTDGEVPA